MERLSFFDQIAHKISSSGLPPLNMQGAGILDPSKAPFEVNAKILAEHIAARLGKFPILRKKLVQDPIKIGDLRMVDDPDFDVWDHITFATLPSPGDEETLLRHISRFSAQPLDLHKPMWRFEIIEGLEGGKIAMVQKLSHATMDGMAAMKIMGSIFDTEQVPPSKLEKSSWKPDAVPTKLTLLRSAIKESAQRFGVDTPKTLLALSKDLSKAAQKALAEKLKNEEVETTNDSDKKSAVKAKPTSLNGTISPNKRNVANISFDLHRLKAISKALDCKINDLSLVMASEALSNYFKGIGESVDDLITCMPMNTRNPDDKQHGNALSLPMINLHNTTSDIGKRLEAIKAETLKAKSARPSKSGAKENSINITAMFSPIIIDFAMKVLNVTQPWEKINFPANLVVSNVPGPQGDIFIAGMPITNQIPMIPVFHKAALTVGVTSIGDHLSFGLHACGKTVKKENMHLLTDGFQKAFDELEKLAAKAPAVEVTKAKPATTKKSPAPKAAPKKAPARRKAPARKKPTAQKTAAAKKSTPANSNETSS
jgi:diacylglycerol O-acyltransferase